MPFTARSGVQIHYEVAGSGRALVLLHGLMGSLEWWRAAGYVDALAGDYQLLAVDARGHGQSDKPHDPASYDVAHMVRDVVAILDECGLAAASLCGWSMGGDTALAFAALEPKRTNAVVAIGAFGYGVGFDDGPRLPEAEIVAAGQGFAQRGTAGPAEDLESAGQHRLAELVRRADPAAMAARTRLLLRLPPLGRRLRDIETPLLLIWGELERPPQLPLPASAAVLEIPNADHLGTFLQVDVVSQAIRRFVSTSGAPSSTR